MFRFFCPKNYYSLHYEMQRHYVKEFFFAELPKLLIKENTLNNCQRRRTWFFFHTAIVHVNTAGCVK